MGNNEVEDILINLYDGAYGPTLVFTVNSKKNLYKFKNLFSDLSEGKIAEIKLSERIDFRNSGFEDLVLKSSPNRKFDSNKINIINKSSNPVIIWSLSFDEWDNCVGLIGALTEAQHPSHQYLTSESDGILFEFTYLELVKDLSTDT